MDETERAEAAAVITVVVVLLLIFMGTCLVIKGCTQEVGNTRLGQKIEYWLGDTNPESKGETQ